jgi:hypothetical protein
MTVVDLVDLAANHYESTRLAAICAAAFVALLAATYLLGRVRLGLVPAGARVFDYRRSLLMSAAVALGTGSALALFLFMLAESRPRAA